MVVVCMVCALVWSSVRGLLWQHCVDRSMDSGEPGACGKGLATCGRYFSAAPFPALLPWSPSRHPPGRELWLKCGDALAQDADGVCGLPLLHHLHGSVHLPRIFLGAQRVMRMRRARISDEPS